MADDSLTIDQQRALATASARARLAQSAPADDSAAPAPPDDTMTKLRAVPGQALRDMGTDISNAGAGALAGGAQIIGNIDRASASVLKKIGIDTGGEERYQRWRDQIEPSMTSLNTRAGQAGKMAGEIAGTVPVALATDNPWAAGAASGLLTTEADTPGRAAEDAAIGAIGGKLGSKLLSKTTQNPALSSDVRTLLNEGVTPTIGQTQGGTAKTLEQAATSLPFARESVINAQNRALQSYNRAAVNRALRPIGETLPNGVEVGHDAVGYAADRLSSAYNSLLPHLATQNDPQWARAMGDIATKAENTLPADKAAQFAKMLGGVTQPFAQGPATILGDTVKEMDSQLGFYGRQFSKAADPDHQTMGDLFNDARDELRQLMIRSNPNSADRLKAIDTGYANLVRIEKAAGSSGAASTGIFTPAQLQAAVKSADTSVRKRAISRGTGLMQDLASAGQNVMGQKIPDSGTPLRTIVASPFKSAMSIPPSLATSALYSRPGQAIARGIAAGARPQVLQGIGAAAEPFAGIIGGTAATGLLPAPD